MRIRRFSGFRAYALLLAATGILTGTYTLILAAGIPLLFVLTAAVATTPAIDDAVTVTRELTPETPAPGESIAVTLTVENTGTSTIPDLRVVDGVPPEIGVTDGSPRSGGALRPGDQYTVTYTIRADRGSYSFEPVTLRARNTSGTRLAETTKTADGIDRFECRVTIEDIPVQQTTAYAGQLATDSGGPGVEFHATREYRPGDPVKRLDWRSYAKTGELATIEFREQHAAHITVLIDSRRAAHTAADRNAPTGATLSAYAATIALEVLINEGHEVSLGALGVADPETDRHPPAWAAAEEGRSFVPHATAICNAAATSTTDESHTAPGSATTDDPTADNTPPGASVADGGVAWNRTRSLVPTGAQVILCSPVTDAPITDLVESLRADGHAVTILSPATTPATIGGRITGMQRAVRLESLRLLGATVIDWESEDSLRDALTRLTGMDR